MAFLLGPTTRSIFLQTGGQEEHDPSFDGLCDAPRTQTLLQRSSDRLRGTIAHENTG
jgi:hypothetical protein